MNTTRLIALLTLTTPLSAMAADAPPVDTSDWQCEYCVVVEGWNGEIEIGAGSVSDDSAKFGEYNGLDEKGGYFIGNAKLYYRNPDASYMNLTLSDAGLDTRSLSVEGGKQGTYKVFLSYDEIVHNISTTGMTPYLGIGTDTLTLPAGWTRGTTTAGMTDLDASLQPVAIGTERKRIGAGFAFTPGAESHWKYAVSARQDSKEGNKRVAGSFFLNTAQLIQPIDYVTDEVNASITYNIKDWQASIAYYASSFQNENRSLIWQNAFTSAAGVDNGELALPPDNEFHQIMLSTGYDLGKHSHVSGDIAVGKMEQNEMFLPNSINAAVVSALPATSANAEVDTTDAKLRYTTRPTDKLRVNASYTYNDRDNKTPQLDFDWVTTDLNLNSGADQRTNLPYSFTRNVAKINADYEIQDGVKLGGGYDLENHERTFQEIEETDENTFWGRLRIREVAKMFFELKLSRADRDTSAYQAVAEIDPPQNVLLRKYNMADRVRDTISVHINSSPEPEYTIGLNVDIASDDYTDSAIGLTSSESFNLTTDLTAMMSQDTSVYFFVSHEEIESIQQGSNNFNIPNWTATNNDTVNSAGIGFTHVLIEDKLDIGADLTKVNSTGEIRVNTGATPAFPELGTQLETFKLYANYRLKESTHVRVAYWFESYDISDWTTENVSPDTIPNALTLGEFTPSYNVNVVKLSMLYKF